MLSKRAFARHRIGLADPVSMRRSRLIVIFSVLLFGASTASGRDSSRFADVHLHYNWNQAEELSPQQAVARLRELGVEFGVVSSRPPESALSLTDAAGGWLLPFFMPYLEPDRKRDWFFDERVLPAARQALASGRFKGLGEIHLISGYTPSLQKPHPVIDGMFDLALEFDVPICVHADASDHRYWAPLCKRHPQARIFWAHVGGVMAPEEIDRLLSVCPNVWGELSARDPWRFGGAQAIVGEDGALLPEWRRLVLKYQDRFLLGSDPFFYDNQDAWESQNTGWNHIGAYLGFHRRWLAALPPEVADKLRWGNAAQFFRVRAQQ